MPFPSPGLPIVIAGGALADAETLADVGVIEALCDADRDVGSAASHLQCGGMISPLVAPDALSLFSLSGVELI
jgi:hypothetical protein